MFLLLAGLFICVPFIELALLIRLGISIGFWPTLFIQVMTGIAGASLARWQGFWVWSRIQHEIINGAMPAEALIDGLLIFVAGMVLLTPGLLTDLFGFILLIPFSRQWIKQWLRKKLEIMREQRDPRMTIIIK